VILYSSKCVTILAPRLINVLCENKRGMNEVLLVSVLFSLQEAAKTNSLSCDEHHY
jgi:hypothetical protein